jgi:hypothetical protein
MRQEADTDLDPASPLFELDGLWQNHSYFKAVAFNSATPAS